jgi:hypothetical protein
LPEKEKTRFLTAYARLLVSHGKVEEAVQVTIDKHILGDQHQTSTPGKPTPIDVTSRHVAGLNLRGILMTTQGYMAFMAIHLVFSDVLFLTPTFCFVFESNLQ